VIALVQTAAKRSWTIFEADFKDCSMASGPVARRSRRWKRFGCAGSGARQHVFDAISANFFGSLDREILMELVKHA